MFTRTTSRRPQMSRPSTAPSFAVQRFIQPKLAVGPVDDPFEREADRVAEQVVNRLPPVGPGVSSCRAEAGGGGNQEKAPRIGTAK